MAALLESIHCRSDRVPGTGYPEVAPAGRGMWGRAGRATPSRASSWNAQVQADLSAQISPPQAIFWSPFSPLAASASPKGTMGGAAQLHLGSGRRGAIRKQADGTQAVKSEAASSDPGQRPVPMTLLPAALITNRVPDRCWRPGLRSSRSGLKMSHFPFTVC